jgi:hypothetical protein
MKDDRLDQLIHELFEESLGAAGRTELNDRLSADPRARARYRRAVAIHATLARKASSPAYFEAPAPAIPAPRFSRSWLAAAAILTLSATVAAVLATRFNRPRAWVLESVGVSWADGSVAPPADRLPVAVPIEITGGFLRLGFPSGARVTLEGPCRFRFDEKEALSLLHGRASVHTPDGAEGFRIDTPGGRFVDLGTEFGLAVGSDGTTPVVLTEVFQGEVEVQPTPRESTRLKVGESRALVREAGRSRLLAALDESPVMLVNHTIHPPRHSTGTGNLALGKPVFSPGYCTRPHGSVFPPDNLTDGRLDDSGVPGDWSFWLAPDGDSGEITVDLLRPEKIGRLSLQNTRNRGIDDRGTARFEAFGSLDNKRYFPLVAGELPRATVSAGAGLPFHDFSFVPVAARYVKVVVTEHYRHLERPADHPCQGGGLNEIRIFEQ